MSSNALTLTPPEQGFIPVDGFRLEYTFWPGERRTFVAIHGFGGTSRTFRKLAEELQTYDVGLVSIGLPWHGESKSTGAEKINLHTFAPALAKTLRDIGIPRSPLIAHSFGGRIAVALAVLGNDFVSRLYLLSSGGFYPYEDYMFAGFSSKIGQFFMKNERVSGFISGLMIPNLQGQARKLAGDALFKMGNSYPEISLRKSGILGRCYNIKVPVHVLWGEKDQLVPSSYAKEVAQWFRESDVEIFQDAGHLLFAEQPKRVAEYIVKKAGLF